MLPGGTGVAGEFGGVQQARFRFQGGFQPRSPRATRQARRLLWIPFSACSTRSTSRRGWSPSCHAPRPNQSRGALVIFSDDSSYFQISRISREGRQPVEARSRHQEVHPPVQGLEFHITVHDRTSAGHSPRRTTGGCSCSGSIPAPASRPRRRRHRCPPARPLRRHGLAAPAGRQSGQDAKLANFARPCGRREAADAEYKLDARRSAWATIGEEAGQHGRTAGKPPAEVLGRRSRSSRSVKYCPRTSMT